MSFVRLSLCGLVLSLACTTENGIDASAPTVAPEEPLATSTVTPTRSAAAAAGPTVLWTAPPTPKLAPTIAPTPVPIPPAAPTAPAITPAAPATPRPARSPAPTPSPTRAVASPTADPFRWTRYSSSPGNTAIYVPATWSVVPSTLYATSHVNFAASPEVPRALLDDYAVLATVRALRGPAPFASVDAFADALIRGPFSGATVVREPGVHATGPVVFLTYRAQLGAHPVTQQFDALFVSGGTGWILGLRAPLDRVRQHTATFNGIFERFRPGSPGG